jgi:hypothetical protein
MMRGIVIGSLITAVLLMGAAFAAATLWIGVLLSLFVGAIWLAGLGYGRSRLMGLSLAGLVTTAAVGAVLDVSPTLLVTSIALALFAWTMGDVAEQLTAVPEMRDEAAVIKKHVQWAGGVIGLGWLLGVVALNLQLGLAFGWVLLLGIIVIIALSLFVRRLRPEPLP